MFKEGYQNTMTHILSYCHMTHLSVNYHYVKNTYTDKTGKEYRKIKILLSDQQHSLLTFTKRL